MAGTTRIPVRVGCAVPVAKVAPRDGDRYSEPDGGARGWGGPLWGGWGGSPCRRPLISAPQAKNFGG